LPVYNLLTSKQLWAFRDYRVVVRFVAHQLENKGCEAGRFPRNLME
jgi:hypothetical protein